MPKLISLDLTPVGAPPAGVVRAGPRFRASDYRLHGGGDRGERHWLLQHPYGRQLLVARLAQVRPEVRGYRYRTAPEQDVHLDEMIDDLDLRDWPQPRTGSERIQAALMLVRYVFSMAGFKRPDWRSIYATGGTTA